MENRIEEDNNNFVAKSRNLAYALKWLGFNYYKYPSKKHFGKNVYSFERNEKFDRVLGILMELKGLS